ncbi:MAG: DEAD/DEAH box helicase, partial [Betaproteobacteria bacterium]|nr:DEAD/DEAH box helicase [Betaproteobacteria bacterium]
MSRSPAVEDRRTPRCACGGETGRHHALGDPLAPAREWFVAQGWTPFGFQEAVWAAYARGQSGLVHAPTGMGKTYAAALPPMLLGPAGSADAPPPLTLLWITPLRALAADTGLALKRAAADLAPHWTVDVRTGDTGPAARARQGKVLPTALVTTPESLTLFLARADWRERFAHLKTIVADEWHELMGTKRGVQTELALARLRGLEPQLRIWGLSATLANLDDALACLVGPRAIERAAIVKGLDA